MPTDPRKRQKKLEKRDTRRKAKRHEVFRQTHAGLAERLATAAKCPILDSWAATDLWDKGLGWVCLSRKLPDTFVAFVIFLVDRSCLGVKNVYTDIVGPSVYESRVLRRFRSQFSVKELTPADVRKFVESAVEYARALGLHPHPDYETATLLFGDIDPAESREQLEFGENGKPFFIAGPNDTPERCRRILKTLEQHCGPDGFHYTIPLMEPSEVLPESLVRQDPRVIGPDETGEIRDFRLSEFQQPDPEDSES